MLTRSAYSSTFAYPWRSPGRSCFSDAPGYDPSMGDLGSTIGPVRISLENVIAAFPDLPLYGFAGTEIVKIGIDAANPYAGTGL